MYTYTYIYACGVQLNSNDPYLGSISCCKKRKKKKKKKIYACWPLIEAEALDLKRMTATNVIEQCTGLDKNLDVAI